MKPLPVWRLVTATSLIALAGCGATARVSGPGGGVAPAAATSAPPTSTSTSEAVPVAAAPMTAAPVAGATPAAMPVPSPKPQPAMPPPASATFGITPLFPLGAAGTITAVSSSRGAHYHVTVTGLVAGSVHTIHDHAGTCGSASRSMHLAVLATATADSHGVIVFDTTVPPFDFGAGRIVIVYDSARPVLITGCAML